MNFIVVKSDFKNEKRDFNEERKAGQKTFNSGQSYSQLYHPVANVIISCLEKRANFINRGLFEVKNLQSETFVAEKFALTTHTRLVEGFVRDFARFQSEINLIVFGLPGSPGGKLLPSNGEPKYRLIFTPIDNIFNFSRGFGECGSAFLLQSILPGGDFENIFSLFYHFRLQKFLYAENKGLVFFENKKMKALNRRAMLNLAINSAAIREPEVLKAGSSVKQFMMSESIVDDAFSLACGYIDAIYYKDLKNYEALPLCVLAKSLGCFVRGIEESAKNTQLISLTRIFAGCEALAKLF